MNVGGHEVKARQQFCLLTVLQQACLYTTLFVGASWRGPVYMWLRLTICFHSVLLARTQLGLKCSKGHTSRCEQQSDTRFGAMYRNGDHLYRLDLLLQHEVKKKKRAFSAYTVHSGCATFVFETPLFFPH